MFLLLSYLCNKYTLKYLPEELQDIFYYLLRKKHIYPKNLLQDIKLLHQDYYSDNYDTLLSIFSINLNNISYHKTNIFPLNKDTFFCSVQIINYFRNIQYPVYYSNRVNHSSIKYTLTNNINPNINDIRDISIALQEYTYEDFKFTSQYFDSNDYIEKYPDINEYYEEVQRIKQIIQDFFDLILQQHNLPLIERNIQGLSVRCCHFKSLHKALLRII